MERYQVTLSYDGTHFHGFQRQTRGRTVQEVVERVLLKVGWQGKFILAAGRTDAGVHARGQVIAFDLEWKHSSRDLKRAINAYLPLDIIATRVVKVVPNFDPRWDALSRRYHYAVFCQEDRDPFQERYAWRVWPLVDIEVVRKATQPLVGEHDFAAFGTSPRSGGRTVRTIFQACWQQSQRDLIFEVSGNAFLYRMVRRIVYLLVKVGQGIYDLDCIPTYLKCSTSTKIGYKYVQGLAPAHGLTLMEVTYPSGVYLE